MTAVTSPAQAQVSACGNTSNTGNSNGTRPLNPAPTQSSAEHSQNSQPKPHPPRSASLSRSCHCSHAHAVDDGLMAMDAMARLEAVLGGMEHVEHGPAFQTDLERLNTALTGHLEWLDPRNAELRLACGPDALLVTVLLERLSPDGLRILATSREGMGTGAPHTTASLERVLNWLQQRQPNAQLRFRSDRNGPLQQQASIATPDAPAPH